MLSGFSVYVTAFTHPDSGLAYLPLYLLDRHLGYHVVWSVSSRGSHTIAKSQSETLSTLALESRKTGA